MRDETKPLTLNDIPFDVWHILFLYYLSVADALSVRGVNRNLNAAFKSAARGTALQNKFFQEGLSSIQIAVSTNDLYISRNFLDSCVVLTTPNPPQPGKTFKPVRLPENCVKVLQISASRSHAVLYGLAVDASPIIAICDGRNDDYHADARIDFETAVLPDHFRKVQHIFAAARVSFVLGEDAEGKPIAAFAPYRPGYETIFRPIILPVEMAKILHHAVCYEIFGIFGYDQIWGHILISGLDANGRPVLAAWGHNSRGQLGTGDNEDVIGDQCRLVDIPAQIAKVNMLRVNQNCSLICGEDSDGNALLATAGTCNFPNSNKFVVKHPQVLNVTHAKLSDGGLITLIGMNGENPIYLVTIKPPMVQDENELEAPTHGNEFHNHRNSELWILPRLTHRVEHLALYRNSAEVFVVDAAGVPMVLRPDDSGQYGITDLPRAINKVIKIASLDHFPRHDDEGILVFGITKAGRPVFTFCSMISNMRYPLLTLDECFRQEFPLAPSLSIFQNPVVALSDSEDEKSETAICGLR